MVNNCATTVEAAKRVRADLVGIDQATCEGITVSSRTPVLALCRALTVRENTKNGTPRFVTYRPGPDRARSVGGQPQSDLNDVPLLAEPSEPAAQAEGAVS
jgi:hypothetical protein